MAIVFSALASFGGKSSSNGRLRADDQVFCLVMILVISRDVSLWYDSLNVEGGSRTDVKPDFIRQFGQTDPASSTGYTLSSQRQSIITSLLSAGTFFGAFLQSEFSFMNATMWIDTNT
jgi:hypothetical protein